MTYAGNIFFWAQGSSRHELATPNGCGSVSSLVLEALPDVISVTAIIPARISILMAVRRGIVKILLPGIRRRVAAIPVSSAPRLVSDRFSRHFSVLKKRTFFQRESVVYWLIFSLHSLQMGPSGAPQMEQLGGGGASGMLSMPVPARI